MPVLPQFSEIIAEAPYDRMGEEFQQTFGAWLDTTTLPEELSRTACFNVLAFQLFQQRLRLASKYNTYFAKQMVQGDRELWKERYTGRGRTPCYSFAIKDLKRTRRFHQWCEMHREKPNQTRVWDTGKSPHPELPCGPHSPLSPMQAWARLHQPQFRARNDGPFYLRRFHYAQGVYLIEHPTSQWVPNIRQEAQEYWSRSLDSARPFSERTKCLGSFEFLWYWTNPFGRAGAMTGDALSLLAQKTMVQEGQPLRIRSGFYHQDCEALILPFQEYVEKRSRDMTNGFTPSFPMDPELTM